MAFTSSADVRGRVHAYLVATGILMLLTVASALIAPRLAGNGARSMLTIGVAVGEGLVGLLLFMKLRGEGAAVRRTVALTAFLIVVTLLLPALSERCPRQ